MAEEYWVLQCPNCGRWRSKIVRALQNSMFKCMSCDKGRKLRHKDEFGLAIKCALKTMSGSEAAKKVAEMNAKRGTGCQ
jgi:uncharacterized Zn finger protein